MTQFRAGLFDFIHEQLNLHFPKHKARRISKFIECLPVLRTSEALEILFAYSFFGGKTIRHGISKDISAIKRMDNSDIKRMASMTPSFEEWQTRILGRVELSEQQYKEL